MAIYFIASVKNNHLDDIQTLAKQLEERGCRINLITKMLGIISGSVEDGHAIDQLKIDGIDKIEIDRKLGPFNQ